MDSVTLLVATLWMLREVFHAWNTHKLLNKLMSRSYYDFQLAENSGKLDKTPTFERKPTQEDHDWDNQRADTAGILDGIG